MGNWNRRYLPRKKYKHFEHEDPPLSHQTTCQTHSYSSGVDNRGVPSWEISYCNSVRVPWYKVLASKKYIYCHPSVFNWDDSAAKEAFESAKQRYWAKISGLPCGNPLPSPDIFIDEIDWNAHMDPQLMEDLERQFFNPDKEQEADKLDKVNEEVSYAEAKNDKNEHIVENPWERSPVEDGCLKDMAHGWGQWDNSVNHKNDNPWEQRDDKLDDSWKEYGWRSGNESWGWNQRHDNGVGASGVGDYRCGDPWNYGSQTTSVKPDGWGQRKMNFQGWNYGNASIHQSRNCGYYGNSLGNNYHKGSKERGWGDNADPSWGWRDSEFPANDSRFWDSRQPRRGGRNSRGGCRKRESSLQNPSKYKSSRYQGYDHGDNRQV